MAASNLFRSQKCQNGGLGRILPLKSPFKKSPGSPEATLGTSRGRHMAAYHLFRSQKFQNGGSGRRSPVRSPFENSAGSFEGPQGTSRGPHMAASHLFRSSEFQKGGSGRTLPLKSHFEKPPSSLRPFWGLQWGPHMAASHLFRSQKFQNRESGIILPSRLPFKKSLAPLSPLWNFKGVSYGSISFVWFLEFSVRRVGQNITFQIALQTSPGSPEATQGTSRGPHMAASHLFHSEKFQNGGSGRILPLKSPFGKTQAPLRPHWGLQGGVIWQHLTCFVLRDVRTEVRPEYYL